MAAKIALVFFGIVALCSAAPGFIKSGYHDHHVIHAPLQHIHNIHHHHVEKVHVPVIKKVIVHDHHKVHELHHDIGFHGFHGDAFHSEGFHGDAFHSEGFHGGFHGDIHAHVEHHAPIHHAEPGWW